MWKILFSIVALMIGCRATEALAEPQPLAHGSVAEAVSRLRPGEYLWEPQIAPDGPVLVMINRRTQRLVVYRNGVPIGISTVSTGRPGYTTPTGLFPILQKRVEHYSSTYNNAPMPYMQRLTQRGIALHAGQLPGYPASHGCIRLPHEFARSLFGVTQIGTLVRISDTPSLPRLGLNSDLQTIDRQLTRHLDGATIWEPSAPTGPVTIMGSVADRRLIVIRNGRIIGSAPLSAPETQSASSFRLTVGGEWERVPLSGQQGVGPVRSPFELVSVDAAFLAQLESVLAPGTTFLLVPDSLRRGL